jgi:hypothetical protein
MRNVHVVSRLKYHVLSNGALVVGVILILCTGKLSKLFTEALFAFNIHFQHIELNLQEIHVHHSKEPKFWSRNYVKILNLRCICTHDLCL